MRPESPIETARESEKDRFPPPTATILSDCSEPLFGGGDTDFDSLPETYLLGSKKVLILDFSQTCSNRFMSELGCHEFTKWPESE